MSQIITTRTVDPYYDDYDSSKQYTHLLARPGRVAQAREITQIQTTVKDIIKNIGDSILKDGSVIEGCQINVNEAKTSVKITSGKIYLKGMVLPVKDDSKPNKETEVPITGQGTEVIGAKLVEYLITEQDDTSLLDPALGQDNYGQPGCDRVQSKIVITVNDPDAATIATLVNGDMQIESYAPEYDTLTQTLARRTYDESGSYLVEGLKVRTESISSTNNDKYNVVVESGKAYVLGYELKIPTARRLQANRSLTYKTLVSPASTKYNETTPYAYKYNILYRGHPYVKNIIEVIGVKETATPEQLTISSSTGESALSRTGVVSITSITQGNTTFTEGVDFNLDATRGSTVYIVWTGTNSPEVGSSYNVTYRYTHAFTSGTDYELGLLPDGHHALIWKTTGDHPVNNTTLTIRYNLYLARKDVVYMDRYGTISILEGEPEESGNEVAPEAPLNTLALAILNNPPGGSVSSTSTSESIYVENVGLTRFTMKDIQSLVNRIKTIEYDQAVLSLRDEARNDMVSDKKGIFADPLIDLSYIDFYIRASGASTSLFDMALDLSTNIAYLPVSSSTNNAVYRTATNPTSTTKKYGRLLTLGTVSDTETLANNGKVVLSQMSATKSFLINPYSMFPQVPQVSVTPSVDSWINESVIEVPVSLQDSSVVSMSTRTIDNRTLNNLWDTTVSSTSVSETAIGTSTTTYTNESVVSESAVTYIRQRTLTVEGYDFPANLDGIKCYFDGVLVSLTPAGSTLAGTPAGSITTVKSDSSGYLKATFTIPANILTGTREVLLKSDTIRDGYLSEGFTLYIAQGINRNIRRTVTTLTTVLLERTVTTTLTSTTVNVDPVGQTFVLDKMTMLKGIDLYFESKPDVNTPVICEIRGVSNGTITSQVYSHVSLLPSQVNVSNNSSSATRFEFSDPVLIEENKEYAFVVRSTSNAYTIWVSELGGTDVLTNSTVLKNPYMTGVMLSSSNNSTWTSHQTTDIKFRLISDKYATSSVAYFEELTLTGNDFAEKFSRIYLAADAATPTGTNVSWAYSVDGGTSYNTITPYNITNLKELKETISLRATLTRREDINLSPMIALDTISLITSCYATEGKYVTKNISNLTGYTKVKVLLDTYEESSGGPTGTLISVKVSTDNGATWINVPRNNNANSITSYSYYWNERIYEATVSTATQCRLMIIATSSSKAVTPAFRRVRAIFYDGGDD